MKKAIIMFPKYQYDGQELIVKFLLCIPKQEAFRYEEMGFSIRGRALKNKTTLLDTKKEYKIRCEIQLSNDEIADLDIKNPIRLTYMKDGERQEVGMTSCWYCGKYAGILTDKIISIPNSNYACYFLITADNLVLTVREKNVTDSPREKMKIMFAYMLSKLAFWYRPILLYEKHASRYEESGSIVYEQLIDQGYKNAYFILDKNYQFREDIKEKYQQNLIDKYSFRHYLAFFSAKTFIGSELVSHAIELRAISKFVRVHIAKGKYHSIFLQHGVMYMISLDAHQRTMFAPKKNRGINRTVVSSQLEKEHFVQLGKYRDDALYLTGLPKYDRNTLYEGCNKIAIMLTWRPWEERQCKIDVTQSTYFKALEEIVAGIPTEYQEHIWIMPHPLIQEKIERQDSPLKFMLAPKEKYDDLLKHVKILITDYSSICYDSFYRGSNIIFYWKEKDACVVNYGENAKLMLTKELAFGPICYDAKELGDAVKECMEHGQKQEYLERYHKIVEFHDGKNTERLVELLKKEKLI